MSRPRVLFVERQIRAFRLGFLYHLARELAEHGVELLAVDEHRTPDRRYWDRLSSDDVPIVEVATRSFSLAGRELVWMSLGDLVRPTDLVVMPQQAKLLTLYPFMLRQRSGGPKVALWGHGFTASQSDHPVPRRIKRWLSTSPHWWFAYTEETARIVASFGYPQDRITVAGNTTDTSVLRAHLGAVTEADRTQLRQELDLEGANVGLFLGTLRDDKRLPFLFAAAERIRDRVPDFELVVAGNGEEAELVRSAASRHPWIHSAGPRLGRELATLLAIADVLVVPSWVGLVVVDGFTAGVPLIASADATHPPEIAYIDDGVNGRVVDDGGDPAVYADAVSEVLLDRDLHARLVEGCRTTARRFSAEQMAREFADGALAALSTGRRSRVSAAR